MEVKNNPQETPVAAQWRQSGEQILPENIHDFNPSPEGYNLYPVHTLGAGKIFDGFTTLAAWIIEKKTVLIDGYVGVFWSEIERLLQTEFTKKQVKVNWLHTADQMKTAATVMELVNPFLGEAKSVWGKKTDLKLNDFFETGFSTNQPDTEYEVNIVIGVGAALLNWDAPIIYLDIPKNEIQYRMRAGSITNLGAATTASAFEMYKRFYFVDWPVLNNHKAEILKRISVVADAQHKSSIKWVEANELNKGLKQISQSVFRVRPWFEAGAWGGHWMQENIEGLNKDEINYAWSFEMIVPENGIIFESSGNLLEVTFDFLMFSENQSVLGKHASIFGTEFPIRFDFLDTMDGGNLSIQCHPSLKYIREEFGENITQDETYYILECKDDAKVYLGFQEDINPIEFNQALIKSQQLKQEIDIEQFVQVHDAQKHDLFLIPNRTVHSAGANNLVLEISATPYIFTFKMYDWVRLGLDGQPRPINIEHAFKNLDFSRKGEVVKEELISKPSVIEKGADWELIHLPTHREHFYAIQRMEFDGEITVNTNNTCHILMLVEGSTIQLKNTDGQITEFHYAETFVVPAAAESYTLINKGSNRAKVIKAFVKDNLTAVNL
ncbi:ROK family transcriptional regulator [Pedobacter kyungheensis]|uniref:ROK family transcriptional regulator n=1 Tax=Pedobacter kyungheensis TaxID=1069985 RepID=A0A0C1FJT1_9SPHI|nr:class I mannose-6-phosphate isomerase [Pedobacter kyungheensis]KIA92073.1 ROK family transcriptional regulator [Pedobacter kyungheensis]